MVTQFLFRLTCLHKLAVLQDHMAYKLCLMGSYELLKKKCFFNMYISFIMCMIKCAAVCVVCNSLYKKLKKKVTTEFGVVPPV